MQSQSCQRDHNADIYNAFLIPNAIAFISTRSFTLTLCHMEISLRRYVGVISTYAILPLNERLHMRHVQPL